LYEALESCSETPVDVIRLFGLCKKLSPHDLWTHGKEIVTNIKAVIQPNVPRKVQGNEINDLESENFSSLTSPEKLQLVKSGENLFSILLELFRDVWYLLNDVYPRHLWEMTSNALLPTGSVQLNVDELTVDPLQILRCDPKVLRCAPIMSILLHILAASLAASKYYLGKHVIVSTLDRD